MSEFFDELARTLAKPMPRRRVLRLLGGTLLGVAMPSALQPALARGAPVSTLGFCEKKCSGAFPVACLCKNDRNPGPYAGCFETCGPPGSTCCCVKGSDGFNSGVVACPSGTRCGRRGEENCPCDNKCGTRCCGKDEYCANASKGLCCKHGGGACGSTCCDPGEYCATNRKQEGSGDFVAEICCKRGESFCTRGSPARAFCCPRGTRCCSSGTKGLGGLVASSCCSRLTQTCDRGVCRCKPGHTVRCGKDCCHPRLHKCCGTVHKRCVPRGTDCDALPNA